MESEWKNIFMPMPAEDEPWPRRKIDYGFSSPKAAEEYMVKLKTEPHPWNNIVTDESLKAMTEESGKSVVTGKRYDRTIRSWSAEEAMGREVPDSPSQRYQWDGRMVQTGLAGPLPKPLPDVYGVAFTAVELEAWSDPRARAAIVEAFAAADDEQSGLLGAGKRNVNY